MAVRKKLKEYPTSVVLPKETRAWLRTESKKQDLSISQLIRRIVQASFDFSTRNKGNLDNEE